MLLAFFSFEHWENLCKFNSNVFEHAKDIQGVDIKWLCHNMSQALTGFVQAVPPGQGPGLPMAAPVVSPAADSDFG